MMLTEEKFCLFLQQCWERSPVHLIKVSKRARQIKANTTDGKFFSVSSLSQCFEEYRWNSSGYEENKECLEALSSNLRSAMMTQNHEAAESAFCRIYKWGGVRFGPAKKPNISGKMLKKWSKKQKLIENIDDSLDIISTGSGLERFDGVDLFMNSGFTKVVSLASKPDKTLIIFDGRVGAALGHLVVLAMREGGYVGLDSALRFPWGAARTESVNRNPSTEAVKFPSLFGNQKHFPHAQAMHIASRIANEVSAKLSISPRQLEAALFMWGYDVSQ